MSGVTPPAIEFRDVWKSFGGVIANAGVSFAVRAGSIHGVVGENGAGKSTAMKMLFGLYPPTSGEIRLGGVAVRFPSPREAMAAGVGMVHQHFKLARPFSALDNIILGAEPLRSSLLPRLWRQVDRKSARERLESIMDSTGLKVPLDSLVDDLPVGVQQRIEILKLLYRNARVLILDEPTAVLTPQEVNELFVMLRRLRDEGHSILLVTHKLREVLEFADDITVLRDGQVAGSVSAASATAESLAELMVGRSVALRLNVEASAHSGESVLDVRELSVEHPHAPRPALSDVSLSVRRGEIVGIAGVEGNGQSELLAAITHPRARVRRGKGTVSVCGRDVSRWSTAQVRSLPVAVFPEDRLRDGILSGFPLWENLLLGYQSGSRFSWGGWIRRSWLKRETARVLEEFDVRPRMPEVNIGTLSGGNQQKFVVGRECLREPSLILATHPTRGVDVGAIEFLHRRLVAARDAGAGVLLVSSELDEVLALSDRVLVMFEGRIMAEFIRGEYDETIIGRVMGGGSR